MPRHDNDSASPGLLLTIGSLSAKFLLLVAYYLLLLPCALLVKSLNPLQTRTNDQTAATNWTQPNRILYPYEPGSRTLFK